MTATHHAANVEATNEEHGLRVRVFRDITAENAADVCAAVLEEWEARGRPRRLMLDLRGVQHIDSSGVGALMEIRHRATQANVRVVFCRLEPGPRRLLERTGVSRLLEIRDSPEERTSLLPPARAREDRFVEAPPKRKRRHRALWALVWLCVVVGGLAAIGVSAWPTLQNYHAQLERVPILSGFMQALDQRVLAMEQGLKSRFDALETRLTGHASAERRQHQRMQAELDRRTADIKARLDAVESAQRATDARVSDLQQQIDQGRDIPQQ